MHGLQFKRGSPRAQRGISLLVVTILILGIVMMTLTGFYISKTQYKLVGNIQASEVAFSNAEAVTADARVWLSVRENAKSAAFDTYDPASTTTAHLYPTGKLAALGRTPTSMVWNNTNSTASGDGRYFIELLARNLRAPGESLEVGHGATACKSADLFRVVAKAGAAQDGARIIEIVEATAGC